jgi:hypothetical protein
VLVYRLTYSSTLKIEASCSSRRRLTLNGLDGVVSQKIGLLTSFTLSPLLSNPPNSYIPPMDKRIESSSPRIVMQWNLSLVATCGFHSDAVNLQKILLRILIIVSVVAAYSTVVLSWFYQLLSLLKKFVFDLVTVGQTSFLLPNQ